MGRSFLPNRLLPAARTTTVTAPRLFRTAPAAAISLILALLAAVGLQIIVSAPPASAASSVGGTIARSEVLSRAMSWVGNSAIHYSQDQANAYPDVDGRRYRPDCSGFVSMAWHLDRRAGSTWDHSTETLPEVAHQIAKDELLPGDIMLRRGGDNAHVTLFNGWRDAARSTYNVLEQGAAQVAESEPGVNYPHAAVYRWSTAYDSGFRPWRYNKIVEDAALPADSVVRLGDITGDGKADVGGQYANGDLRVWASTGNLSADGQLFNGANALVGTAWTAAYVQRIVTGDFTGDGKADLAGQFANGDLRVWASTGNLSGDAQLYNGANALVGTGWTTSNVQRIVTGDFTGDGRTDIGAQFVNGDLRVWASTGDLSADGRLFGGATALVGTAWTPANVQRIVTGDFTGDGKTDIAGQLANGDLRVWASTGNLSADAQLFNGANALVGTGWTTATVQRIMTGDFTGDGRTDIGAQYPNGDLRVWASTGNLPSTWQSFNGATALVGTGWTAGTVQRIVIGDFTGDRKADIGAQFANGDLRVWASTGNLTADAQLFNGAAALAGTGWTASTIQRIV
jgi:hypothetical protein